MQDIETFYPTSSQDWRAWLIENHNVKQSIWLVCYKKQANVPTITWSDAVDEALCFGWIDSTRKSVDSDKFIQFFTRRKPSSNWSKINKAKIERLVAEGLMTEAGLESVERAKQNGSWTILDQVEELHVPEDLLAAFEVNAGAKEYFTSLSKSVKKMLLYWVVSAKRPETRQNRINEIAVLAAQNLKPKQFR
ncbi:YdeI/OmpD-associated family protein [Flavobacterium sp. Fl-318]|uniref:YdeI/OmpD-associated family protein n=1 Tax=Flavobacterium cupriresistens TaxID=2893885 RepID=A0ABU4R9F1_9FLAO|nr:MULTISPECIES: YdeI/OmpD-associated family protein [unclassified Flavobacterium]MDX6189197.1 YdeI/OmpD-associated family protein [Flavobacterium sp. Fl-318]UFH41294.1 YdeI/OmpD-associated family protein [Flavobacterium sp. F-323]